MRKLAFAPLHQHTDRSLLDGAAKPKALAARCRDLGHPACACTDHGNVLAHFDFWHEMRAVGVKPILGCCLPGQLIYTINGVKPIEEIEVGELVLTHRGRFRRVTATMTRPYEGTIHGIKARNCETVWLTSEHPVLVKRNGSESLDWVRADELVGGTRYKTPGPSRWREYACVPRLWKSSLDFTFDVLSFLPTNQGFEEWDGVIWRAKSERKSDRNVNFKIPRFLPLTEDLAHLIGAYLANGNINRWKKSTPSAVRFTFNRNTGSSHEEVIQNYAATFEIEAKVHDRPEHGAHEVDVNNQVFARFIAELCGERFDGKRIPPVFYNAPSKIQDALLRGLQGDAKVNPENGYCQFRMANRGIIYDVRLLAASLGWLGKASPYDYDGHPGWTTQYQRLARYRRYLETDDYLQVPITKIEQREYAGPVFNIEVEEDNSYVTDFAVHNCEAYHVEDVAAYANTKETEGERRQGERKAMEFAHLTILARTQEGYRNLLALVSESYRHFYRKPILDNQILFKRQSGLVILSGCVIGRLSQLINADREDEAFAMMERYANELEQYVIELVPCPGLPISERALPTLYRMAQKLGLPMVATDDSHFCRPEEFIVQDTLLCANTGQKVFAADRTIQLPDMHWRCTGEEVLERLTACLPGVPETELREIVERSEMIAAECEDVELPRAGSPVFTVPVDFTAERVLRQEALDGMIERLEAKGIHPGHRDAQPYYDRAERELDVLCRLELANYMLVVWDLVREMRSRDILVVPRGSAGGSLVLWALGVTVVDPIKHDLPFERFCDEQKRDLDVDLDFQHDRRHEAFEYLEAKYGAENCAHVANVVTFGARQALLDGGKVLDIPDWALHAMARLVPEGEDADAGLHDTEVLKRLFERNETAKKVLAKVPALKVVAALEGHVRNMSVHAGGFLVSAVPIETFTAVMQRPIRDKGKVVGHGERVASLTKDQAAALGALKLDALGSKTLTAIKETLDQCGLSLDWLYNLPIEDAGVFEMLGRGENLGIFQLQGVAAGRIMRKLKPETFDEFVAVSALARPGPLQSGSVDHFIDRKHGVEEMPELHPALASLAPTYGIVAYQEQAMALAAAASFPGPDVQKVRKLVSKVGGADAIEEYKERLCVGWFEAGVPVDQIIEVYGQVKKAANYCFCAAHAVQYGYVGMWTGHLKLKYPDVFTAALCRNVGGNDPDDRIFALLREFVERDGAVTLIDPIESDASFSFGHYGLRVVGGFGSLKGVGPKTAPKVMAKMPFESWEALYKALGKRAGLPLAASGIDKGALDSDILQSLSPWFPLRPLLPEEVKVRDRITVPIAQIREAVRRGWQADVWVVGRITQRVAIDLVAQAKKYGSEAPAPGDPTTKLRMVLTDESGSLDVGFSAKCWAAHARSGLLNGPGAGLGNTVAAKVWWSEEWERFFVREARLLRVWRPFAVPRNGKRPDDDESGD